MIDSCVGKGKYAREVNKVTEGIENQRRDASEGAGETPAYIIIQ
jgi:hypothetical protein